MRLVFLVGLAGTPWPVICLIISLILLFIAAFVTAGGGTEGPFYRRVSFGWAGLFFYVLAVAIS